MKAKVTNKNEYVEVRRVIIFYWLEKAGSWELETIEAAGEYLAEALGLAKVKENGFAVIRADQHLPSLDFFFGDSIPYKVYEQEPPVAQLLADERERVLESVRRWPFLKDGWSHLPELRENNLEQLIDAAEKAHKEACKLYINEPTEEAIAETVPPECLKPLLEQIHLIRSHAANLRDFGDQANPAGH